MSLNCGGGETPQGGDIGVRPPRSNQGEQFAIAVPEVGNPLASRGHLGSLQRGKPDQGVHQCRADDDGTIVFPSQGSRKILLCALFGDDGANADS